MQHMTVSQFEPWLDGEELKLLAECIQDSWITGGPKVKEFEQKIAELCSVKYSVACTNGTTALFMGLVALGIEKGDEVIVPDFTFIASANAVILTGGTPVFVDVDKNTLNIDVSKIKVTKKTKAIMPVHIYGQSADMSKMLEFSLAHKLAVVEDAAQGIGVKWIDRPVGGLSHVGCLSFYTDKTITTGEGGMILTNCKSIYEKCLRLSHQGNLEKGRYIHESIGFNFRMTDLQAAIGLAQLKKLPDIIRMKRTNDGLYRILLKGLADFTVVDNRCYNVPFREVIFVDNPEELVKYLGIKGIIAKRVFYPLHKQPCYSYMSIANVDFPNSIWAYEHGVALPFYATLTREQIEYVCLWVSEFIRCN